MRGQRDDNQRRPAKPTLLDTIRRECRARQFSGRTAEAYASWVRRYVLYHGKRHPRELGADAIAAFLTHLANERNVSVSTQRQAASALLFLYRDVLALPVDPPHGLIAPPRRRRLPTVLAREEVVALLSHLSGTNRLVASLLYGSGLRLMEALQLRVKDVSIERAEILVRSGKGGHDRVTVLPEAVAADLTRQIARVRRQHAADVSRGAGWVALPMAFGRKAPHAGQEFAWQYLFPAARHYVDPATGQRRRHHLHETAVQRAVSLAVRDAALSKRATCHTLRHSFATHLLEDRHDIRTSQELRGHRNVKTTMIYTHVLNRGAGGIVSPLDRLSR